MGYFSTLDLCQQEYDNRCPPCPEDEDETDYLIDEVGYEPWDEGDYHD